MLPPEVNSGRMFAGPGPSSLLAAAASWSSAGEGLFTAAQAYRATLSDLATAWMGRSSAAAVSSGVLYATWLEATAAQALHTSAQLDATVAAFEAAHAATVHPAIVFSNREQVATLNATNLLGVNTPAIMALEAVYAEMWAQDATAMYTYLASSVETWKLDRFTPPAQSTTPSAVTAQPAAVTEAAATPAGSAQSVLSSLSNFFSDPTVQTVNGYLENVVSGGSFNPTNIAGLLFSGHDFLPGQYPDELAPTMRNIFSEPQAVIDGVAPPNATATAGTAAQIRGLSVPEGWGQQAMLASHSSPQTTPLATEETAPGPAGAPGMYGAPGAGRGSFQQVKYGRKLTVIPKPTIS